jgi:hypothetical protein
MKKLYLNADRRSPNPIFYKRIIGRVWKSKDFYEKNVKIDDIILIKQIKERVMLKKIKETEKYIIVDIVGLD